MSTQTSSAHGIPLNKKILVVSCCPAGHHFLDEPIHGFCRSPQVLAKVDLGETEGVKSLKSDNIAEARSNTAGDELEPGDLISRLLGGEEDACMHFTKCIVEI